MKNISMTPCLLQIYGPSSKFGFGFLGWDVGSRVCLNVMDSKKVWSTEF